MSLDFKPHSWTVIAQNGDVEHQVTGQITPLTPGKTLDTYGELEVLRPYEAYIEAEDAAYHPIGAEVTWNDEKYVVRLPPITFSGVGDCDHSRVLIAKLGDS